MPFVTVPFSFLLVTGGAGLSMLGDALVAGGTALTALGAANNQGVLNAANFAQTTYSEAFSTDSEALFPGKTINDVAGELESGQLSPADVPVQYIVRDGNTLILNTRSAQALTRAGIPRSEWNAINLTGNPAAEARLTGQLQRNGLSSMGTPTVTSTGGG